MKTRLLCLLILASASSFLFSGCGRKESATGPALKVLQVGNGGEPQFLDPQIATGIPEHGILRAVFEGLVTQNVVDGPPLPGVAEKWDISEDRLTYTFHLRQDARWSDGRPLTSEDFLRSYERILNPNLAADYVYMMFVVKNAQAYYQRKLTDFTQTGFKAPDAHTLEITLEKPAPFFLNALVHEAWYPVPTWVIEQHGGLARRESIWTRPEFFVGNGPFHLKTWQPGQKIVVERSPTYWGRDHVKLDQIVFHAIELTDPEERMFRTGQLHMTNEVPLTKIPVYRQNFPESLRSEPWCGTYFYRFNIARKPFDDVRVRRALALAIERERLVENVTLAGEEPAYALVPPNTAGYRSKYKLEGDIAEAKRLLAEAGYPDGKGFPIVELLYNTLENHRVIAEAVQEMWRRNLGIDITLHNEEWKVYLADQKSMNFALQRAGWIADYVDPHVFFDLWHTGGGNNNTNWGSPEYDRLLATALDAKSDDERYAVYQEMEKILIDEMPILPMYYYKRTRLVSPNVTNYRIDFLDQFPWKAVDLAP